MIGLIKLLEQSLLIEGRVEDVLKKYKGKVDKKTIDNFVEAQNQIDPSINNKYLDWMVKEYISGNSEDSIINVVGLWHKNLDKIDNELFSNRYPEFSDNVDVIKMMKNPKDINSYKNLEYLKVIASDASKKISKKEEEDLIKAETRLVYQNNNYQIRVPLTYLASCKYGAGTAWCTRLPDTDKYFKDYTTDGILFYVIDRKMANQVEHPLFKVAVLMKKETGECTIWNARDKNVGTDLAFFFPPDMVRAMLDYRHKYVTNLNVLIKGVTKKLSEIEYNYGSWSIRNVSGRTILTNGKMDISTVFGLKDKKITLTLIMFDKEISTYEISIPAVYVKEIEDILVDAGIDSELVLGWLKRMVELIFTNLDAFYSKFQPFVISIKTHQIIENNINNYTGNWKFNSEHVPDENNKKSVFKCKRIIGDYTYWLTVTLDYEKELFILGCEESLNGGYKEQYADQDSTFNPELLEKPSALAEELLLWVRDVVSSMYTEDWESYDEIDDEETLQQIVGSYVSDRYGSFEVDIDDDGKIRVYSDKLKSQYLMKNVRAFTDTIINQYGLKKV